MSSLYEQALVHFGRDHQLRKTQEECGELIVAINHYCNGRKGGKEELVEEIADMHIMLNQVKLLVDKQKLADALRLRSSKLKSRIDSLETNESYK